MSIKRMGALVMALGLLGALIPATALASSSAYWNVAGTYKVDVTQNVPTVDPKVYVETLILTQSGIGTITGTSLNYDGNCSLFTISSGSVVGNAITINGSSLCGLTLLMTGDIAADGSMSGHWGTFDGRGGHWATTSGFATSVPVNSHEKTALVPYPSGPAVGAVIFNSSAGDPNNLEMTVQLKKVTPDTTYDVYLFLDTYASGQGVVVGTFTTNGVGNGTFHVNTHVTPGIHTVAVDVTLHGSGNDVFVTPGLYGQNLFLFFK